ncbi:serine/threonine-protein kinase [Streptomyces sp. NPDC002851]
MGEVFAGRYELVDPIGRGGVGAVWRAWDHRRRRYVAAKVLQQSDAHSLLRFVREQALRIDHPHVLAPTSWAADDDKVLFTMDLICGGSLAHVIGDYGPLPPAYVCTLLDQLLAGLAAVHAEDVVHRDIKPANILMEATGTGRPHLRLSDFGIAMRKGEPRLTETDYVVGTPGYFAPEQMLGAEPDFPADLFAVGLVALYLLEGAKPDAKALIEHFAEHGTPGAPRGVPEPLWQVVAGLVQPDPESRFRTATGARKALTAAAELLPEPGPDDELVEIFDQLGPLPSDFGPDGPLRPRTDITSAGMGRGPRTSTGTGTGTGTGSGTGAGMGTSPNPPPAAPPAPPAPAHPPIPPIPSMAPTAAPQPFSPSDTGSFRLPPPPPGRTPSPPPPRPYAPPAQPSTPPPAPPTPPAHPHDATPSPPPAPAPAPAHSSHTAHTESPAQSFTQATAPRLPARAEPQPQPQESTRDLSRTPEAGDPAKSPRKRVGPPRKVVVPVLLLAVLSYAVGIWALTRI